MTALARLFRTTAFKLSLAYLAAFVAFAIFAIGYVAWNTERLLMAQITETIETEINSLAEQYRLDGTRRLIATIDRRVRQPGSFLYLVLDPRGETIAGNAMLGQTQRSRGSGWQELPYSRPDEQADMDRLALARIFVLPSGLRLVVGRDLEERQRLRGVFRRARAWTVLAGILLGGFAGVFVTRRVLKRVEAITQSSRAIMGGDMGRRLPVAGVGDEFDRLAGSLNQMLDRIGELMSGLREVSDNIAHDLRTPLTRLRNRAEEALRQAGDAAVSHEALARIIDEADELIKLFDALLMIARAEAGSLTDAMQPLDAAEVARNVVELYEPVAEEEGMPISIRADAALPVRASRELLSRALSNLIDNALKYGRRSGEDNAIAVEAGTSADGIELIVADRGDGVPEADRERVLERFVRLEESRASPGSGLGLSLVAAVARLHGGSFRLEDNRPGLRAVLSLPRLPAAA